MLIKSKHFKIIITVINICYIAMFTYFLTLIRSNTLRLSTPLCFYKIVTEIYGNLRINIYHTKVSNIYLYKKHYTSIYVSTAVEYSKSQGTPLLVNATGSPICSLRCITKLKSLGAMVILPLWMVQRFPSSIRFTKKTFLASCNAKMASVVNLRFISISWAISRTTLWKGSFHIRNSTDFWYFLISITACMPGLYLLGFF